MTRTVAIVIGCAAAACVATADAETYTWTDAQGTVHFTEDLGTVPAKLRKKVRKLGDDEPVAAPVVKQEVKQTSVKGGAAATVGKGEPQAVETFAGKTYDQWKVELSVREEAMAAVRKRIDEIVATVKNPTRKIEQQQLIDEHAALVKQFKEMREDYDRQVETMRKAGLQVNLQ